MAKNVNENKMGTKKMFPLIISMSLPAMFSMLIMALYNVVDSIFVSRYSAKALTAVSLAYPLQLVGISFAVGTAIGVNSLIARKLGAKDFKEADSAATHGVLLALFNSLLFILIGLTLSRPFISLFTQDSEIISYGVSYLSIVLCVGFGSMFSVMFEKTLQATGNMLIPMLAQLLGAVINIVCDPLLIFGLWIFPEMGVVGAAVATVFGQICSAIFLTCMLFFKKHEVKVSFKNFKFSFTTIKNIYTVGLPAIIMQAIGSVMVSGINAIITLSGVSSIVGEMYVSVFGIYFKVQSFVFMPVFGLNQGVSPIIGYNYGARNQKRLYQAFMLSIAIAGCIMLLGTALFQFGSGLILSLFTEDTQLINIGIPVFKIISLHFVVASFGMMFSSLFQAVGKGLYSMIMSICRQLAVILPVAYLLSKTGLNNMWFSFLIAETVCVIIAIFFFRGLKKKEFDYLENNPSTHNAFPFKKKVI